MTRQDSRGYEDDYGGIGFDSCDELIAALDGLTDTHNWPMWVEQNDPAEPPARMEIGYFCHRKGRSFIAYADDPTEDHMTAARVHIMNSMMGRADSMFRRYTDAVHRIES